ncbi:MAG TPA: ABC transporter substrate-binding protein [Actinocrinis sp.]|uniref:ABC transporter substrate-binding protein n=1 Tax=Actinocrinis sp. TaxID=1920516 RepID=UPI002DDD169E|nr:ABC transporter substrate-binding protein [Actinocrinis sp.]HEV2345015.1 ABC transporter substrate-binding protein [Actinocrinis sp.]
MSARQKRKVAAVAFAAAVALSAAACSSGSGSNSSSNSSDGVADGKPLDPSATVTISVDCAPASDQPGLQAQYNDDLATFRVKYPHVTINPLPKTKCEDPAPFTAMLKGHTETNAFYAYFTDQNQVLNSGEAADVTQYINAQTVPGFADMLPTVKSEISNGGKVYALPRMYYTTGLVYNRDLFTKAGLNPDQPPTTWADVATDAAKISALGGGVTGYEDYSGNNTGGWHFGDEIDSLGGALTTADGKKAAFNDAHGQQVLQTLYDMRWKTNGIGPTPVTQWADAFPPLASDKVGMMIGAPDVISHLTNSLGDKPDKWGLGPMPGGSGPATGTQDGGDLFYFKKSDTPNQIKAAVAWLNYEYLTPGQGQFNYARNVALSGDPGTNKFIAVGLPEPELWAPNTPMSQADAAALKSSGANMPVANYAAYLNNPVPGVPEPPVAAQQIYAVLDNAMSAVMTNKSADISSLLSDAEGKVNSLLANQ